MRRPVCLSDQLYSQVEVQSCVFQPAPCRCLCISAGIGCPVPRIPAEASPLADHVSATRILCGALVFPTIATIVGKLMFSSVNSNLQRTILVGTTRNSSCIQHRKCTQVNKVRITVPVSQGTSENRAVSAAVRVWMIDHNSAAGKRQWRRLRAVCYSEA